MNQNSNGAPSPPTPPDHRAGFVALVGRTNAGKSTLMNRLVEAPVSITTPTPQTTRNRILGIRPMDGAQVIFVDTPGLHRPRNRLGRSMQENALGSMKDVDLVCLLVDVTRPDAEVLRGTPAGELFPEAAPEQDQLMMDQLAEIGLPTVLVFNKVDLLKRKELLLPLVEAYNGAHDFDETIPVSALHGDGTDQLLGCLAEMLPQSPPLFPSDIITDRAERWLVGELIREQVIRCTEQEVPYSTAVEIDSFDEAQRDEEKGIVKVHATILVERESQKPILIGRKGSMLKRIGTEARRKIEDFLDVQVFLKLWVKVEKNWVKDPSALKRLGYE